MALFQYQARTSEAVQTAGPEAVSVDRWLPTWVQPSRALASIAALVAGSFAPVLAPAAAAPTDWIQQQPQPSRAFGPRLADALAAPVFVPVLPLDWVQSHPQPSRTQRYAPGSSVVVVSTAPEASTADRFQPTCPTPSARPVRPPDATVSPPSVTTALDWLAQHPQPQAARPRASGSAVVPAPVPPPPVDWLSQHPQPSRKPSYASWSPAPSNVAPIASGEVVTADKWLAQQPQPSRAQRYGAGSGVVVVSTAAEATSADRWQPTHPQPAPRPTRPTGGTAAPVLAPAAAAAPSTDWLVQQPQPGRSVRYARGTASVGAGSAAVAGGFNAAYIVRSYVLGQGVNEVYQRNTAGQTLGFNLVTIAGADAPAASVTVLRVIDAGTQSAAGGTVTAKGGGQYSFAPTAADLNGDAVSFLFSATGCVSCERTVITTGVLLLPAGLDSITVETGLNARQALALKAAQAAGSDTYDPATGNVVIYAAGQAMTSGNVRITATTSSTGRVTTIHPPD